MGLNSIPVNEILKLRQTFTRRGLQTFSEMPDLGITQHYSDFFSLTGALGLDLLSKKIVKTIIKQEFSGFFRFHSRVLGLNLTDIGT